MRQAGVVTPDHTIRTKNWPLLVPPPAAGDLAALREAVARRRSPLMPSATTPISPQQRARQAAQDQARSLAARGAGAGPRPVRARRFSKDAAIAADIAENTIATITDAEAIGRFECCRRGRHVRCRILVAGAGQARQAPGEAARRARSPSSPAPAGAIGAATAKRLRRAGAEVALLDRRRRRRAAMAKAIGGAALALAAATSPTPAPSRAAFARVAAAFGGVDIVVSNAGAAWQGRDRRRRRSACCGERFELNFFAHQRVAQARRADHARAGHRRLPAVQCLEAGGQSRAAISAPTACPRRRRCF